MATTTTRNARSRHQRGVARAALENHRRKVKLQEDSLTALFTHLEDMEHARVKAGEQISELRGLGLTLAEIAELTGKPANRLSWLSRLATQEDENPEGTGSAGEQEVDPAEEPAEEDGSEAGDESVTGNENTTRGTVE